MQTYTLAAEAAANGNPLLNIAIFGAFIVVTLFIVTKAGKTTSESSDFYTGGASFSGTQNGLAIAGDYLSAASFLLSLIHISEPTRHFKRSRMPSSA